MPAPLPFLSRGMTFDSIRVEYTTMLQNQLAKGNNGLIKTKYLTFRHRRRQHQIRPSPVWSALRPTFSTTSSAWAWPPRLWTARQLGSQLHGIFHMDEQVPFRFEWDWLAPSGLSTKDFIAPSGFEFRTGKQFRMGKKYGAVSFCRFSRRS